MKKLVVAILASLYLTASAGATVHLHYCMNQLVDAGLWHKEEKNCGKCGMDKTDEKDNGCCKDEHKQVKLENDHKATTVYQLTELAIILPVAIFELTCNSLPTVTEQNPISHAPPRSGKIEVYIKNCVFRI